MQIIVLGMHRSGTSAVARLLNMMGAYFANENVAMLPTTANPKGYWEREDVRQLNDNTISSLGMSWDNISDFEPKMLTPDIQESFEPQAQKIIFGLEMQRPWMIKDPRFCLLLPLWRPLLEVPVMVYVYRSPIQVAQSLQQRNKLPLTLGVALWEKYNLYGLAFTANFPRILVLHEELMTNPIEAAKKLYQQLSACDVQGLRLPADKEIRAFIEPKFFRERGDTQLQHAYINQQQAKLVEAFENNTIFELNPLPQLSAGTTEILQEYKNQLVARQEAIFLQQEIGKRDQEIIQRDQEISRQEQEISRHATQLAQQQEEFRQQAAELAKLQENLVQQATELAKRDEQLVQSREIIKNLEQSLQTKEAEKSQYVSQVASYKNQYSFAKQEIVALKQEKSQIVQQKTNLQLELAKIQNTLVQTQGSLAEKERFLEAKEQLWREQEQQQQQLWREKEKAQEQEKDQLVVAGNNKISKQLQINQQLIHWIHGLHEDTKAIFNSLTWRSGNIFTQIVLRLMLRKPGLTARDHIKEIMAHVAALQQTPVSTMLERSVVTLPPIVPIPKSELSQISPNLPPDTLPESLVNTTALPPPLATLPVTNPRDYSLWIQRYDTLTRKQKKRMQEVMAQWNYLPFFSIVMPTYNTEEKWLRAAIDSVLAQIYPNWELCIADDASTKPQIRRVLEEYAQRDQRIKITFRTTNGHISAASNTALEMVSGELVTFLDHDDELAPQALFWIAKDVFDYPDTMLWYSDEDKINEQGERFDPYFKCDWNPDLFLSHNLITHLAVYRTALIRKIAGFRVGYEGAQDYDLALRAIDQISFIHIRHIPRVLYHWRTIVGSTAMRPDEKPYAIIAAQKSIQEYLDRHNINAQVTESPDIAGTTRVKYALPVHLPLVSLIIPTRNGLELLHRCVESIYSRTDYTHFEVLIINNNSDDSATLAYLQQLQTEGRARVVDYPHPFNYADMNNMAVLQAEGEIIGLLNNDIEVINREWLAEMVSHAVRPEVGVVGARLWYPNDTLQHGGVVLGIGGVAGHSHKGLPRGVAGYFGRAGLLQNFSAVTGACIIMRKANFLNVGGLDAENLAIAFNDVDLCLKMNRHGLRVVWTPYAELYHHESASRGYEDTPEKMARFERERNQMKGRWPQFLMADPAYSPNLTLETQDFAYAWPPRVPTLP